ncbi:hypothetical protein OG320_10595 [Microbispora sp. NBC_01189]|uniref:hypothetical protein n=1 Tax=Microbispora sp. NBC_01189 TaxID=2903583 RepID=UPI002E0F4A1F|nr:hypothetical protein OG320_10595 [Microbispora sp. NBC_01189]
MLRTLNRLGDRLLERLLPGAEARADTCYYVGPVYGPPGYECHHTKNCYPNPTGSICLQYTRSDCGTWRYVGYC